jgi:alkane 1-monooxygenase
MHKDYRYLFAFSIPLLSLIAILRPDRYAFLPLVFSFVLVPLLDKMIPVNHPSPLSPLEEDERKNNFLFDLFLYACVPLQWGVLLTFLSAAQNPLLNKLEITGMVIATGLCSGIIGINVAHELGHRKNPFDRFCAKLLLLSSLYMHFFIEHNKGHHRRVGTPDDPATGRLGETVYTFILRSVSGSYRSAWQIQRDELRKKKCYVYKQFESDALVSDASIGARFDHCFACRILYCFAFSSHCLHRDIIAGSDQLYRTLWPEAKANIYRSI